MPTAYPPKRLLLSWRLRRLGCGRSAAATEKKNEMKASMTPISPSTQPRGIKSRLPRAEEASPAEAGFVGRGRFWRTRRAEARSAMASGGRSDNQRGTGRPGGDRRPQGQRNQAPREGGEGRSDNRGEGRGEGRRDDRRSDNRGEPRDDNRGKFGGRVIARIEVTARIAVRVPSATTTSRSRHASKPSRRARRSRSIRIRPLPSSQLSRSS